MLMSEVSSQRKMKLPSMRILRDDVLTMGAELLSEARKSLVGLHPACIYGVVNPCSTNNIEADEV